MEGGLRDGGCWTARVVGLEEGLRDMELCLNRVALLAACKVVAVMLTIHAHASLFRTPPHPPHPPHPHSVHLDLLDYCSLNSRSLVRESTGHIPLHPMAVAPLRL